MIKNDYEIVGDMVYIYLKSKKHGERVCLIDLEDFDKVKGTVGVDGLATCARFWDGEKTVKVHIAILGKKDGFVIDHIDGNPLNNCKSNLRFVSQKVNSRNKKKSGYTFNKAVGKYKVRYYPDRTEVFVCWCDTLLEARMMSKTINSLANNFYGS